MFFLALVFLSTTAHAQQAQRGAQVIQEVKHDVSPPLRDIKPKPRHSGPVEEHENYFPHAPGPIEHLPDTALQTSVLPQVATTAGLNFDGVSENGYVPPDTNGSAGQTQFVQWVNAEFAVYDKSDGKLLYGPIAGNTLWSGFGGPCETYNDGDPIALYDKLNNRWIMSQLMVATPPNYYQCVAVSTTDDATGTFNRYAFAEPSFNDYPKIGVWPDAYYITFNTDLGAQLCAMDGAAMRAGNAATQQCFVVSLSLGLVLPGDVDGRTPPPVGETESFLSVDPNGSSINLLEMHVDFSDPSNTTLAGPTNLSVSAFSEACGSHSGIPQANTTQLLGSLCGLPMYRLAYRNFGDHESLVVNHSVVAGSSVGVRWYEIRSPANDPVVYQQGTFAPDSNYRWMGSIAMDNAGDTAVGYSVSSSSINPAIRYTGRVPSDPLGSMESETSIIEGIGSQTGFDRWGDYTSMSVDPVDDCTFWYTNEYLPQDGFNWHTRIASFKFTNCTGGAIPDFSITPTPGSQTVVQGSGASYTVTIGALNGFTSNVALTASGLPTGASATFSPTSLTVPGSSTMSITTNSPTPAGTYAITVTGASGNSNHATEVNLVVNSSGPPDFTISASPPSQTVTRAAGTIYTMTIGPLNGFTGTVSFTSTGLPTGAGATFAPSSVTASGNSTMIVTADNSTPAGTYTLTITATSGSLTHSANVNFVVTDFTISASPLSQTVTQGGGASYTVTVGALNGFTGTVSFSTDPLPTGAGVAFTPATVTASGSSTMRLTTSSSTPAGTYTIAIFAVAVGLAHVANVSLLVNSPTPPDFLVSASPGSQAVIRGNRTSYTVTIAALNGFIGTVTFSAGTLPLGVGASFNPASVGGSGTSTMSVTTSTSTQPGTYTITITGTSGALNHSTNIALVVNASTCKLNGQYAFLFSGEDGVNGSAMGRVGDFTVTSTGKVTGGTQDVNDASGPSTSTITSGTCTNGSNGLNTLTLTTSKGTVTYKFAVTNAGNARMIEFDDANPAGTGTRGSGILRKQDKTAFSLTKLAGDWAFSFSGTSVQQGSSGWSRFGVIGRLTTSATGAISKSVIFISNAAQTATTTFTTPSSFAPPNVKSGRGTATETYNLFGTTMTSHFAYYMLTSDEVFFLNTDSTTAVPFVLGQQLRQQGAGTFTDASVKGGTVLSLMGFDTGSGSCPGSPGGTDIFAGEFAADGNGNLSGHLDENDCGNTLVAASASGTYSINRDGTGTLSFCCAQANATRVFSLLVIQQNTFLLLEAPGPTVEVGQAEPQTAGLLTVQGTYNSGSGSNVYPLSEEFGGDVTNSVGLVTFTNTNGTFTETEDISGGTNSPPSGFLDLNLSVIGSYYYTLPAEVHLTTSGGASFSGYVISPQKFVTISDPGPAATLIRYEQ